MHSFEIKSNTNLLVIVAVSINECEIKRAWRIDERTSRGVKEYSHSVFTLKVTPLALQTPLTQLHMG